MKHCLVVDDSDVVRKIAATILESMNYVCLEAASGSEALETCRRSMPDLIVVDSVMPEMSGLDLIPALRMTTDGSRARIIYCTADNDPVEIERAYEVGADEYLLKPFDRLTLSNVLSEIEAR